MPARKVRVCITGLDDRVRHAMVAGDWMLVDDARDADVTLDATAGAAVRDVDVASGTAARPAVHLTPREREVLGWLARGASNADIGLRLFITENTVKNHVRSILGKLDVGSRTEAVVTAARLGIVTL